MSDSLPPSADTGPFPPGRSPRLLVVEDEPDIRDLVSEYLQGRGWTCHACPDGRKAMDILCREEFDLVLSDLRMPLMGGLELLAWIQDKGPRIPVVVMSAWGDVEAAVQAMKLGAADYLSKPFDPEELGIRLGRALRNHRLELAVEQGRRDGGPAPESGDPAMKSVLALAARSAPSDAGILIRGESGSGKEVLARWIHSLSSRREGNFVAINLGGMPEQLLESELFGHEKGAFTGADRRKTGLFELASGGTLFLDEIGDMPMILQVKLLRVLQEKKIQRLGAVSPIPLDTRIIAATHVDLEAAVREGRFREDLMYRLKVIELRIPPLRERPSDIPGLVGRFLDLHGQAQEEVRLGEGVLEALMAHPFPGNVRELENMVQRALILRSGPVMGAEDFGLSSPARGAGVTDSPVMTGTLARIEEAAIRSALDRNRGQRAVTAAELGISRRTLLNKLREYGIQDP